MPEDFHLFLNPDEDVAQPSRYLAKHGLLPGRDGKVVVDHALDWLVDAPDEGWMLWVHLFDPHLPYSHLPDGHEAYKVKHPKQLKHGKLKATRKLKAAVREAYQMEVDYADEQTLRLLEALDARGFFETSTLVFTSDHGEELWEHKGFEHGHSHHREVTDVALAIVTPGLAPGPRFPTEASLLDVTPTLRAIAGLPNPGMGETGLDPPPVRARRPRGQGGGQPQRQPPDQRPQPGQGGCVDPAKARYFTVFLRSQGRPGRAGLPDQRRRSRGRVRGERAEDGGRRRLGEPDVSKQQLCALGYMSGPECERIPRMTPPGPLLPLGRPPHPSTVGRLCYPPALMEIGK